MDWINQFLLACGKQKKEKWCCRKMWIFPSLQKGKDSSQQMTLHKLIFSEEVFFVCVHVCEYILCITKDLGILLIDPCIKRSYIYRVNFCLTVSGASVRCFGRSDPEEMEYMLKLERRGWMNGSLWHTHNAVKPWNTLKIFQSNIINVLKEKSGK